MDPSQVRPVELQEMAIRMDAALYSPWFLLTVIVPALILIPCGLRRSRLLFPGILVAWPCSWFAFFFACRRVADTRHQIALEYDAWISDTAITFAPMAYGFPISLVVTILLSTVAVLIFVRTEPRMPEVVSRGDSAIPPDNPYAASSVSQAGNRQPPSQ